MLCCVVAAYFILRYVIGWQRIREFLGMDEVKKEEYGWGEASELDRFSD